MKRKDISREHEQQGGDSRGNTQSSGQPSDSRLKELRASAKREKATREYKPEQQSGPSRKKPYYGPPVDLPTPKPLERRSLVKRESISDIRE